MNHLLGDHRGNYPGLVLNKNWSLSLSHPIQNVGLEWIFTAEGQEWTRSIEKGEVSLGNYEQRMEISLNVFCKCWRAAWKIPKSTNRTLFAKTTDVANKTISCRDLEWCTCWNIHVWSQSGWRIEFVKVVLLRRSSALSEIICLCYISGQMKKMWKLIWGEALVLLKSSDIENESLCVNLESKVLILVSSFSSFSPCVSLHCGFWPAL